MNQRLRQNIEEMKKETGHAESINLRLEEDNMKLAVREVVVDWNMEYWDELHDVQSEFNRIFDEMGDLDDLDFDKGDAGEAEEVQVVKKRLEHVVAVKDAGTTFLTQAVGSSLSLANKKIKPSITLKISPKISKKSLRNSLTTFSPATIHSSAAKTASKYKGPDAAAVSYFPFNPTGRRYQLDFENEDGEEQRSEDRVQEILELEYAHAFEAYLRKVQIDRKRRSGKTYRPQNKHQKYGNVSSVSPLQQVQICQQRALNEKPLGQS